MCILLQLFTSSDFDIDSDTLKTYHDPQCVDIRTAEKSPVKTRFKLKGTIEEVKLLFLYFYYSNNLTPVCIFTSMNGEL